MTTLATDTVEIASEADLYAKLPLGAVSLQGTLKQQGHLAVRTTVAGQFKLSGDVQDREILTDQSCGKVTHLVSAISVGAFKLFGGGSTKQGAGIVVGSLDIGGETARSETMLREAGKVEGCNSTSDQSPHAEEQWADKGVQVALEAPEDTVSWSLHDKQGAFVCKLPCSRWLGPSSEYFVRRNEVKASGFEDIPVPELACGDQ